MRASRIEDYEVGADGTPGNKSRKGHKMTVVLKNEMPNVDKALKAGANTDILFVRIVDAIGSTSAIIDVQSFANGHECSTTVAIWNVYERLAANGTIRPMFEAVDTTGGALAPSSPSLPKYEIIQDVEDVPGVGFVNERNGRSAGASVSGRKAVESALIQWGEDSKANHIEPRYCWNRRKQYVQDRGRWNVILADGRKLTVTVRKAS